MSGNIEEEKTEGTKIVPLDLASKVSAVKTVDGKGQLLVSGTPLRGMRVITQPTSGQSTVSGSTIITTNIVPSGVLKQGSYVFFFKANALLTHDSFQRTNYVSNSNCYTTYRYYLSCTERSCGCSKFGPTEKYGSCFD